MIDQSSIPRASQVSEKIRIQIGGVDVSKFATSFRLYNAIGRIPSASFSLDFEGMDPALDWQGEVTIRVRTPDEAPLFVGVVARASLSHGQETSLQVAVECRGSGYVLEQPFAGEAHVALPGVDAIHWLLRQSGWPEDRMELEGIDQQQPEVFEILAPLEGIQVQEPVRVGSVTLLRCGDTRFPDLSDEAWRFLTVFESLGTLALVHVDDNRTFDAEARGLEAIDIALAWLESRATDGSAFRGKAAWPFDRSVATGRPVRGNGAFARGLTTGRFVLHTWGGVNAATTRIQQGDAWSMPPLPPRIDRSDSLAILAWSRANGGTVTEQRVQALWDAMEYYAAPVAVPKMFAPSIIDDLVRSTQGVDLTPAQRDRVEGTLRQLNSPPLMIRVIQAASRDGVVLTSAEKRLLGRLRKARNLASHGSNGAVVRAEDLRHGLSLIARLLAARVATYRAAARNVDDG